MGSRGVVLILLALAFVPIASASDTKAEVLPHQMTALSADALRPALTLSDLFAEVANPTFEVRENGTLVASAPSIDVIVARVEPDGTIVTACVHDEKSATEFLTAKGRKISAASQAK